MKTAGKTGGKQQVRRNEDITYPNIRLIDPDGEQLGVVTLEEAQQKAQEAELDLVEVAPGADPPVCRIMDYGKYLFEQKKKQHQARKKQKQIEIKEVKFRPGTDEGDYQVKLRNLRRFLEEGDRAKVSMRFRGREFLHQDVGLKTFDRLEEELADIATVEQRPRIEGRQMVMLLSPKKK